MAIIAFSSAIGPVPLDVVISENHMTSIEITENPIETGAEVHDHAYIKPKKVTLDVRDGAPAATFNALVRFQESRVPFYLVTGLAVYRNMLVKAIDATRDKSNAFVLNAKVDLQEVIIVDTAYVSGDDAGGGAGEPGGKNSRRAARPSAARSGDATTADRAAGPVNRGDTSASVAPTTGNGAEAVQNRSILKGLFE